MNFLKNVLSTIVGIFLFIALSFVAIVLLGALLGSSDEGVVNVKDNSILELKLDFPIKDYAAKTIFEDYPFLNDDSRVGLFNIIDAINYAAQDVKIKGISIDNNYLSAGIAQTKALRDALLKFKESGKFITSYADNYSQLDYYLNSVADTIYMNPVGALDFKGLYTERLYFKDFQEKSGLKMEVVRLGKYKSAVEPYLENEMSEANREQIQVFLQDIWTEMKSEISQSRNVSVEDLDRIAENLEARTATLAKSSQLIDEIAYYDEYIGTLKNALGIAENRNLKSVTIEEYSKYASTKMSTTTTRDRIAIVYAEGTIIYGEGEEDYVGQGAINKSLKIAREDDRVKAIVLRVNSPGGSALASELMWRELEITKAVKPVIVSMGNYAASGGYYIACNADKIFAESTTITGSIGVFGTLPNGNELASNIGINAEQVGTNKNAVSYSFFEPLSEEQRFFIKEGVSDVYELFTKRVAEGRGMTQDNVKNIAQGRVWTGNSALENGLVDEIGGLDAALHYAAEVSGITDYKIKEYPVFRRDLDEVLEGFGLIKSKESILMEELGEEHYKILKEIKSLSKQKGIQLLFPFDTEIK